MHSHRQSTGEKKHLELRSEPENLARSYVWIMAFSCGAIVANLYYMQPLLSSVAQTFGISVPQVGSVAMVTQLGTALGMVFFVPLGDTKERRQLIALLLCCASVCLVLVATSRTLYWLAIASFGVGMTASTVHVILPFAAHLASPEKRGATLGAVLSGLLMGILLARTFSGIVGQWVGWRSVYWFAAALMLLIAAFIRLRLPRSNPELSLSWPELLRSAVSLVRTQPVLREASLVSGLLFSGFSIFWTTLAFFLQTPPYHYGSGVAGLFGLVGAAGAMCTPIVGRLADRYGSRRNVLISILLALSSFVVFYVFGHSIPGLIAGVILLDVGVQSAHVSNQTRMYGLLPEARSRLNMVYMMCYFVCGALGSFFGSIFWHHFGWAGVCGLGCGVMLIACAIHFVTGQESARLLALTETAD